jgi:hypothetical protein
MSARDLKTERKFDEAGEAYLVLANCEPDRFEKANHLKDAVKCFKLAMNQLRLLVALEKTRQELLVQKMVHGYVRTSEELIDTLLGDRLENFPPLPTEIATHVLTIYQELTISDYAKYISLDLEEKIYKTYLYIQKIEEARVIAIEIMDKRLIAGFSNDYIFIVALLDRILGSQTPYINQPLLSSIDAHLLFLFDQHQLTKNHVLSYVEKTLPTTDVFYLLALLIHENFSMYVIEA